MLLVLTVRNARAVISWYVYALDYVRSRSVSKVYNGWVNYLDVDQSNATSADIMEQSEHRGE